MMTIALIALMFGALLFASPKILPVKAEATGSTLNFFLAVEPDIGGPGYFAFSSQTLIAQQGDQINITIRNLANQTFQLKIQNEPTVTIQAGNNNSSGVTPTNTNVPVFTASTPGIFSFSTVEHPEMNGQLVVLPSNWASYTPQSETRSLTQLVLPDFAGDNYDKFFSGVMVVNQGDSVNISVRNTDDEPHGFAIAAYGIDEEINPGIDLANGAIQPTTTAIPTFTASIAGVFTFLCTDYCGAGHLEMTGTFVVLPTGNSGYKPQANTRYNYVTIQPDFAGEGYDKYLPDTIVVNQNDLVYIVIRNTDLNSYGFSLPGFSINNETIAGAQNTTSPTDTYITPFFASQPGIYEFFSSSYIGQGDNQMIGDLVVLPTQNSTITTQPTPIPTEPMSTLIFAGISIALLIVGILIGITIVTKFDKEIPEKNPTANS